MDADCRYDLQAAQFRLFAVGVAAAQWLVSIIAAWPVWAMPVPAVVAGAAAYHVSVERRR